MPLVKVFGNDQSAWIKTMCIWVVIAVVLLLFCFFRCEETVVTEAKKEEKRCRGGGNIKGSCDKQVFLVCAGVVVDPGYPYDHCGNRPALLL